MTIAIYGNKLGLNFTAIAKTYILATATQSCQTLVVAAKCTYSNDGESFSWYFEFQRCWNSSMVYKTDPHSYEDIHILWQAIGHRL